LERDRELLGKQAESRLALPRQQEQEIRMLGERVETLEAENAKLATATPRTGSAGEELEQLRERLQNALVESEYHRQKSQEASGDLKMVRHELAALKRTGGKPDADLVARNEELSRAMRELQEKLARSQARLERVQHGADDPAADTSPREGVDGEFINAFLRKAMEAEKAGETEAAAWNYKQILKRVPDHAVALRRLGALAAKSGNDKEAVEYLQKAFYADPDHLKTLQQLGFALVRQEQADLAVSMLARAAALAPASPDIHKQLGVACSSLGWSDAAEVQFKRALELDKDNPEAAFNLAVLLASKGKDRLDEARKWYALARNQGAEADPALDEFFKYGN
jgi:Flp pilus assembly protein TadD